MIRSVFEYENYAEAQLANLGLFHNFLSTSRFSLEWKKDNNVPLYKKVINIILKTIAQFIGSQYTEKFVKS